MKPGTYKLEFFELLRLIDKFWPPKQISRFVCRWLVRRVTIVPQADEAMWGNGWWAAWWDVCRPAKLSAPGQCEQNIEDLKAIIQERQNRHIHLHSYNPIILAFSVKYYVINTWFTNN